MVGGVLILRIVTATDMSTGETEAQVHPGITHFQAVLAPIGARRDVTYLVEVATWLCHVCMLCFLKCSKTCYDTFVPASSQKVSLIAEPALPAPQAILRSDEATTGTSVIKRRASLRILIAALRSRSRTRPHSWQLKTLSARAKSACIQPQPEQVLLEGNQRSTSCTEPPYCSAL